MKLINIISRKSRPAYALVLAAFMSLTAGCNQLENDDHYSNSNSLINNPELKITGLSSEQYIASRSDFSKMSGLFKTYGIFDELEKKGQLATILMVADSDMAGNRADDDKTEYIVRSHISDISISPSNLHDGDRLMMWHGKFVNISMDEEGQDGAIIDHVKFNNAYVKEVIQTSNGYIYVISDMINTPTSLYDYINELGDDYSIFKELVLASGGKEFDRVNSKPIGVNSEGNTVYDSVFIVTNAHFDEVGVDLNSEALTATMILPSNAVVQEAMADAHRRLEMWGMERDDQVLYNWILDAAFYAKRYAVADMVNNEDAKYIKSVFSKQWRTDAHELDPSASEELSNGIVHKAKRLHIPNNVLMYRLKSHFYLYEYCTQTQKDEYFKMSNMKFNSCNDQNTAFTPLAALWPAVPYRCLILGIGEDGKDSSFRLDFTPIRRVINSDGVSVVEPFLIPPGAYKLTFGSEQNCGLTFTPTVLVGGNVVVTGADVTLGSATTYHYDRGSGGYPEGYDANAVTALGGSKASNYDRDGGPMIDSVVIPDVNGDGSAVPIVIRFEGASWLDKTKFIFHSWCLKPTADNY